MASGMCDATRRKIWHKSGEEQRITTDRCKHSAAQLTTRSTATFWHARGGSRNYLDKTSNQAFFNQTVMSSAVIIKGTAAHVKHELILRWQPRACKHKPVWFGCQGHCIFLSLDCMGLYLASFGLSLWFVAPTPAGTQVWWLQNVCLCKETNLPILTLFYVLILEDRLHKFFFNPSNRCPPPDCWDVYLFVVAVHKTKPE